MKKILHILLMIAAAILYPVNNAVAYVRTPTINGVPFYWNLADPSDSARPIVADGRVTYNLHPAGSDNLPFDQTAQVLASSFKSWEDIPTSNLAFRRGPDTTAATTGTDNIYQVFWLEDSTVTSDGLDISGALAVTRLTTFISGDREGEIVDASTAFNGNQYTWAIDGRPDAMDIQEVAAHEIGHAIGLSHSPIGGATMFPRTGEGRIESRSLSSDDIIAASVMYPEAGFAGSTGTVIGTVRDSIGNIIFGAHVVILDINGNVVTGGLSQPDGTYSIAGLPPGQYSLYAEPLSSNDGAFYSKADLTSYYSNIASDFLTTREYSFDIGANKTIRGDIFVNRGNPDLAAHFISDTTGDSFFNIPASVKQGQNNIVIGVSGPGLPSTGNPLSISGNGIEVLKTFFKTLTNGMTAIMAEVNISHDAAPGSRNIIISNGMQRTVVTGGLDIQGTTAVTPQTEILSTANFTPQIALESLASVYGNNFSSEPVSPPAGPIPTSLGGVTVLIKDANGVELPALLFFVSPQLMNIQIPAGLAAGPATMTVNNISGVNSTTQFTLEQSAPGLFTLDGTGKGFVVGTVFRVKVNNVVSTQPIARFNQFRRRFDPVAIDMRSTKDQVFINVYGTGFRNNSGLTATVGGLNMTATFEGSTPDFPGLDQAKIILDPSLKGKGAVDIILMNGDKKSNPVKIYVR